MQDYKKLLIWQRSFQLAVQIYQVTKKFPKSENWGLKAQLRRASVSISTNITEGASRQSKTDFKRFLNMAYSSLKEVENLLMLSKELKYLLVRDFKPLEKECDELGRMIHSFSSKLNSNTPNR